MQKIKDVDWKGIAYTVLPIISPGLTFFCASQIAGSKGFIRVILIALGIASAALAPFLARLASSRERRNAAMEMEAVISAVADEMGTLAVSRDDTTAELGVIEDKLVRCAAEHGGAKVGAAFYALDDERHLVRVAKHLRDNAPRHFENRDLINLLNAIDNEDIVYIKDNDKTDGNLSIRLANGNRSAIVAPVFSGTVAQGVLIIDAPDPGKLTKKLVRESYVRAVARLLGTAHAMGTPSGTMKPSLPRQPEGEGSGQGTPTTGRND
ncbi:hypothetical protein [Streptomyces sp. NPDC050982]|uniref:hypothetical protein n=1 Tax=Streptomyces sp. NPDC050982 TaxID=3154746 RepID=UPI003401B4EA